MNFCLSFLMGVEEISDEEILNLNIQIVEKTVAGIRKLKIPEHKLSQYLDLVRTKLTLGFWNEIIGEKQILFIFKFNDGAIKEYELSPKNEQEISDLCEEFNDEPPRKAANVYKYLSENGFYHDFMVEQYSDMIGR